MNRLLDIRFHLTGASAVSGGYKCNAKTVTVEVVGPHAVINYPTDKIVVTPASVHVLEFISLLLSQDLKLIRLLGQHLILERTSIKLILLQ